MAMFIQGGIFLTQRLKCFYLKHLFTFQSKKKKNQGLRAPGLYLSPAASQTQHQSCAGENILSPLPEPPR